MKDEEVQVLEKKATYFCKEYLPVHIKFKKDYWMRGYILETSADYFLLNEFKLGEKTIFYLELESIEPFKPKDEEVKDGTIQS